VELLSTIVTLFFVMDPLGNIPVFLSILKIVPSERRTFVLAREIVFAYLVLLVFYLLGRYILQFLRLEQEAVSIAGGIVLFLIALRMIFPGDGALAGDSLAGEPFVVPLAIPLIPGPRRLRRCCCCSDPRNCLQGDCCLHLRSRGRSAGYCCCRLLSSIAYCTSVGSSLWKG
jgi:small neutral amino acid transporter SnatA (MarC family)